MDRPDCDPDTAGPHLQRSLRWSTAPSPAGAGCTAARSGRGCPAPDRQRCWTSAAAAATWPCARPLGSQGRNPARDHGIDPDARAFRFAAEPANPCAAWTSARPAVASSSPRAGSYDVVISNHVLHHLTPAELQQFLDDSAGLARRLALHNDLRRSAAAYALFMPAPCRSPAPTSVRDGLTSIRRSYTVPELAAVVPMGWTVEPALPLPLPAHLHGGRPAVTDVLVVGGGPVGLFLGALLLQQGVAVRVLERGPGGTPTRGPSASIPRRLPPCTASASPSS